MAYHTENETEHFDFEDAVISEIRQGLSTLHLFPDNVKILPENSTNRDIRTMRANGLDLAISGAKITAFVEEGYTVFDADGKLLREVPDREIPETEWQQAFSDLQAAALDGLAREGSTYRIAIRTEDHTARLEVTGDGDTEEWDRYLNL